MARVAILMSVLLLAGCAASMRPGAAPMIAQAQISGMLARAAAQVRPCYRTPRLPRAARQASVVLRVRLAPDGTIAVPPELLRLDEVASANRFAANLLTQAAAAAVVHCAPLRLPPELYHGGWDDFELRFSPGAVA